MLDSTASSMIAGFTSCVCITCSPETNSSPRASHLSHHLLAAYHLGATASLLQAAFDYHATYLRAAYPSPSSIDDKNWKEHLGNEEYA